MGSPPLLDPSPAVGAPALPAQQSLSPIELLSTWQAWNDHDTLTHQITQARAAGNTNRVNTLIHTLRALVEVKPLDALVANHELVRLLLALQPHAIRAARKAGASWHQIATAIDTTAEQACVDCLAHTGTPTATPARTPPPRPSSRSDSPGACAPPRAQLSQGPTPLRGPKSAESDHQPRPRLDPAGQRSSRPR